MNTYLLIFRSCQNVYALAKYPVWKSQTHKTWTTILSTSQGVWPYPQYSDSVQCPRNADINFIPGALFFMWPNFRNVQNTKQCAMFIPSKSVSAASAETKCCVRISSGTTYHHILNCKSRKKKPTANTFNKKKRKIAMRLSACLCLKKNEIMIPVLLHI